MNDCYQYFPNYTGKHNSFKIVLLFITFTVLNIYVILNTDEAIEIVLNALAFTFIARIDEDLTKSGWYDPEKRW